MRGGGLGWTGHWGVDVFVRYHLAEVSGLGWIGHRGIAMRGCLGRTGHRGVDVFVRFNLTFATSVLLAY
jgi:hypothetical protein